MLKAPNVTAGDWEVGEFGDYAGYDCLTAGIQCGPAFLDGNEYGQDVCTAMLPEAQALMMADAKMLAASKKLAEALNAFHSMPYASGPEYAPEFIMVSSDVFTILLENAREALLLAGYVDESTP